MSGITFDFSIVGGRYDGETGMRWHDDGSMPAPEVILVGVCGRGVVCGTTKCAPAREHVSYWTPDEEGRPLDVVRYRKQNEYVHRDAELLSGVAEYVIGGLMEPANFGERARVPAGVEPLTYAGMLQRERMRVGTLRR